MQSSYRMFRYGAVIWRNKYNYQNTSAFCSLMLISAIILFFPLHWDYKKIEFERKKKLILVVVVNRPFPSCCEPHYKSEAKCKTFHMKISFLCIWMKTNFHNKNFALSLAFIMRFKATRKWPIDAIMKMSYWWRFISLITLWQWGTILRSTHIPNQTWWLWRPWQKPSRRLFYRPAFL